MLTPRDAVVNQCGAQNIRDLLFDDHIGAGVQNYSLADQLPGGIVPGGKDLVKALHFHKLADTLANLLAC